MTNEKSASIWTRAFALLCLAQFLGYAQHFMLAPVLPLYVTDLGGSMRLGAQPCHIVPGTRAERVYGEPVVYERHRHRYEVNPAYHEALSGKGLVFSGLSPDGRLVEIIELEDHPFFMAGQFHPELRSRPTRPHPLFRDFVGAAKTIASEAPAPSVVLPG